MPLNAAYADEIVQEENSTYQLSFRFPTSDPLWEKLKEETFLTADDLHGEQDFVIFEVEKKHGYIQVYANQVFTLLNNYVVNPISLDRQTGSTALSRFAGSITRDNPFSFFSDIEDRHTFNIDSKNAMEAFAKDKHSIIGQWGGDLVRHGYQVRLLKKGGSENESLFMYKKNLSSYQHKTSTKSLKTRITFIATVKAEGEKAPDRTFTVTIDSPLINKYSQIYEDVIEVNDQDVKDEASLRKYGEQYFRTSLCDMMEDSLEIEVVGQSDVPVQMFDIVSLFHEVYNLDVRKKITKYTYSPMGKKLNTIGFGQFKSGLANAIGNAVSDAVKGEAQQLQDDFERQLARELKNADLAFDRQKEELVNQFTDGLNAAKARAEEVKRQLSDTIDQRFSSFNSGPLQEAKRRSEEALRNAGASSLLAQEAKRIGLDSVARLEEFKRQATSAQTALSGELDSLKRTIANDIRPKQEQVTAEIAKQVEALIQTKKELVGVKSAQATYEETTTRRLSELTNLANGKASKSELTQTAEELASKIASVKVGGRNLYALSKNYRIASSSHLTDLELDAFSGEISFRATGTDPYVGIAASPPKQANDRDGILIPVLEEKQIYVTISNPLFIRNFISFFDKDKKSIKAYKRYKKSSFIISSEDLEGVAFISLCFGCGGTSFKIGDTIKTKIKIEYGTIPTDWSPAPEDQEERISIVESNFKQRADALDAGVSRLTEGLRTKADISVLNVTAENIRQSVKSLETDTQNKLDQKLSQAEFEVQASSIRQEILNSTKDKADKTLVTAEAGKLRTELSTVQEYVKNDSQRQEALQRYTREESAKQATAVRELVAKDYVGKATYQETVRAIENKFEAITNPQNGSITTRIANYKKSVDGRFADITSLIAGKANQTDFQHVKETSQLYERIIGSNENDISNKVARMALTNQLFQVEVSKNENLKTVQSQLAGSWGVHNKNSVNEIIAGFNLAGRNAGIKAETIRLEGNTLADKLTAIDGYFKRLFVGEGTFATLNADVIRTNSITADKLVFNEALANRMVSNEHITNKLVASRAFVNALKAVTIDASQIVTGTLKGDRIYGGTIRGTEINGTTITGNSRMTIGDNGFLRPTQEGGLQINVPETYSASKGVGVQLLGRELGRIPKGMFIYNSPNWNGGNIIGDNTEDILLTVKGRVSLCNLHNGSPVSGVPIISNFEYQNPIRNLYPIRFIGWDPRSNQLYVDDGTGKSGTWWISVDGSTSDKNLKTNIGDTHYNALDFVQKLMFKEFDWKTDKFGYKKPYTNVGLIAQDVEKIDSSLVYKKGETLALDDFRLLNIALKAIQELALENRKLTHRLENLENERRTA
nr:MAG TPA: Neck appendage protein [Caudoviricetes sp.]